MDAERGKKEREIPENLSEIKNYHRAESRKIFYEESNAFMCVQDQPFYRPGMSGAEAEKELEYLNRNMEEFYKGTYMPLWKQGWFR